MLRRLGLQFAGCFQIWYIGQMQRDSIFAELPTKLTNSLHKRSRLDIANRASHLRYDKIIVLGIRPPEHPPLDFIGDMRHHLNGMTEVVTMTLAIDYRLINPTGGNAVVTRGMNIRKSLIMTKIQVSLKPIIRYVTLAMLIRIERARVDIDIGVEFLNGNAVTARLKQAADAGRDDALSERTNHTACYENVFGMHILLCYLFS